MKKYMFSLLATLVAITAASFTNPNSATSKMKQTAAGYHWYNFNSTDPLDIYDPYNYSLDEDGIPDCPPTSGSLYCEVYAQELSVSEPEYPNVYTIISSTRRP